MSDLVSVIILNWNGKNYIRSCLDKVLLQNYSNMEIIVVDNASDDGSAELIRRSYPSVDLVENKQNLGFGGGNNIGIRRAKGDYVLILNNDAELDEGCIRAMREALDRHPECGGCASKIYFKNNPQIVDAAGIAVFSDGLSTGRGRFEHGSLYEKEEEVFGASGCCALFRREMLEDIKVAGEYYDEDFFAYADDTDLGWRARLSGWGCIYAPEAKTYHLHSAGSGSHSATKAFLVERNRIWLQVKSFPVSLILYGQYFTLMRYFYQAYGAFVGKGASGEFTREHSKMELAKILFKAYSSAIQGYGLMARKRREIRKRSVMGTVEMFRCFKTYGIKTRDMALMRSEAEGTR